MTKRRGHTRHSQFPGSKQRRNPLERELGNRPLDNLHVTELFGGNFLSAATDFVQDLNREPCRRLVLVGDSLNRSHGFILTTTGKQKLGRLIQVEKEKTGKEHDESNGTQCENQVSPAHVAFLGAAGFSCSDLVAGFEVFIARICRHKPPCDQTGAYFISKTSPQ